MQVGFTAWNFNSISDNGDPANHNPVYVFMLEHQILGHFFCNS